MFLLRHLPQRVRCTRSLCSREDSSSGHNSEKPKKEDLEDNQSARLKEIAEYYSQYVQQVESEYSDTKDEAVREPQVEIIPKQLRIAPISSERGKTGVFDLAEIVDVLRWERAEDICVLRVPARLKYVPYMIIACPKSNRHMKALQQNIHKLYKTKMTKKDLPLLVEGSDSNDWKAMDLGNFVLHLMKRDLREKYDLETLWSVGSDLDDLTLAKTKADTFLDTLAERIAKRVEKLDSTSL